MTFDLELPYWARSGFVYFARGGPSGLTKIGFTANVDKRLREISQDLEVRGPVEVLAILAGPRRLEVEMHEIFGAFWVRNEWFSLDDGALAFVAALPSARPVPYQVCSRLRKAS